MHGIAALSLEKDAKGFNLVLLHSRTLHTGMHATKNSRGTATRTHHAAVLPHDTSLWVWTEGH